MIAGNLHRMRFSCLCLASLGLFSVAHAQNMLTLQEALNLGKQRNGTILAAMKDVDAAKARVSQSKSAFLPSVTLSYGYSDERIENFDVGGDDPFRTTLTKGGSFTLSTSITLLDTGERRLGVRSASYALQSQQSLTLQTLRLTLVDVYALYVDALRAQELQRVSEAEVQRAEDVVKQAEAQAKVGDIAEKDVYQPRADALNAKVNFLSAKNDTARSKADLKAGIGWDNDKDLPPLSPITEVADDEVPLDESEAVALGFKNRADLKSQRFQVSQLATSVSLAKVANGPTVDAGYSFSRQKGDLADSGHGAFSLLISYPLFDGGFRRDDVRIAEANLAAARYDLIQSERTARAEIEALVQENILGKQRIEAANLAREAAKINFEKVLQAKQLGAEGTDLVAVSTAQVSLVTAETNAVQAIYDYAISRIRLRLAVGASVPGETN